MWLGGQHAVAQQLKDKDYKLSFNLFTELGVDGCGKNCEQSLRRSNDKYNKWTSEVVRAIRGTGGKNVHPPLIVGSPGKTAKDLPKINQTIYSNDSVYDGRVAHLGLRAKQKLS